MNSLGPSFKVTTTYASILILSAVNLAAASDHTTIDLANATVVIRPGQLPKAEQSASQVLVEELAKRIGKRLAISTSWPGSGPVVAVTAGTVVQTQAQLVPSGLKGGRPGWRPWGTRS